MKYYVLDENNNKVEAFTKEQVLAVLNQAITDGTLANIVKDAGFISKVKCCVTGETSQIAYVTQAKYNELEASNLLQKNTEYNIIDDTMWEELEATLKELSQDINDANVNAESRLPVYEYNKNTSYSDEQNVIYYAINNFSVTSHLNPITFVLRLNATPYDGMYLVTVFNYGNVSMTTMVRAVKLLDSGTATKVIYCGFSYRDNLNNFTIDQVTTDKYTVGTVKEDTSKTGSGKINASTLLQIVLDWDSTYIFNANGGTFTLKIPPKPTDGSTSVIVNSSFSLVKGASSNYMGYLSHTKYVNESESTPSNLGMFKYDNGSSSVSTDAIDFTYYKL